MRTRLAAVAAILLWLGTNTSAHRLDEYLQATIISVEKDRVRASMRLIPGVAVSRSLIASIDTNGDGILSQTEQRAYAERVLDDLSLTIDGDRLSPRLVSVKFPEVAAMNEGIGEMEIELTADLTRGGPLRRLVVENHHQKDIAAYLVNCLVPRDPDIRVTAQNRNEDQSLYQLDYLQTGSDSDVSSASWWQGLLGRTGVIGFASLFRLGMRHIAEGTDHLLFLLVLLLPAPLLAVGSHWTGLAGWRHSLLQILKIVSAFTVGHSITLALAALGLVRLPGRPVEVLIALSILLSAIHALRPVFPGREAMIAGSFGLIHGLAFAATLGQLGLGPRDRLGSILAFNLGIEAMQLMVVVASIPSLFLLSRARTYSWLRISGAVFAGFASLGWIAERLFDMHNSLDAVVNGVARYPVCIAGVLFLISLVWLVAPQDRRSASRAVNATPNRS